MGGLWTYDDKAAAEGWAIKKKLRYERTGAISVMMESFQFHYDEKHNAEKKLAAEKSSASNVAPKVAAPQAIPHAGANAEHANTEHTI